MSRDDKPAPKLPEPKPRSAPLPRQSAPRTLNSAELFAGGHEVWIEHGGELYRLQLTKVGKLILTK